MGRMHMPTSYRLSDNGRSLFISQLTDRKLIQVFECVFRPLVLQRQVRWSLWSIVYMEVLLYAYVLNTNLIDA